MWIRTGPELGCGGRAGSAAQVIRSMNIQKVEHHMMYLMADLLGLARIERSRPILPLSQEARSRVEEALQILKRTGSFVP